MHGRLLALMSRACLGTLLILNGPANALAIGFVSARSSCCSAHNTETPKDSKQSCKKCCACGTDTAQSNNKAKDTTSKNNIRPTCPICPSCPNFPSGCCISCPCKSPCAPPLVFVIPESPELVWRLADLGICFSDSHTDEPLLPPRFSQFVAITI
jgi:hypothetical protein